MNRELVDHMELLWVELEQHEKKSRRTMDAAEDRAQKVQRCIKKIRADIEEDE